MEGDSGFSSSLISVRIVSIDHYLHPLASYSSSLPFQAARLLHPSAPAAPKLPVIRIFGATPAGQSCCVHVHGLRPYLFLPLPDDVPAAGVFEHAKRLRDALEGCLRTAYSDALDGDNPMPVERAPIDTTSPPARFVAEIEPVLKTDIYGFHASPRIFLKVYTYEPRSVGRIAAIVTQRGLPQELTPTGATAYEAHIPFHMQFLIDHNLSGMGYLNLEECRFRPPMPGATGSDAGKMFSRPNMERTFVSGLERDQKKLFWPFHVAKRARSELELDTFSQHILNARKESDAGEYAFVSRTLRVLWEEERLRTGSYPDRLRNPERCVRAGGHLSEESLQQRLQDVIKVDHMTEKEQNGNEPIDINNFLESQTQTQVPTSPFLPSTYDDMLKILDASGSFEGVAGDGLEIEEFGEEEEAVRDDEVFNDDHPLNRSDFAHDAQSEQCVIRRDWADIANCTQHVSVDVDGKDVYLVQPLRKERAPAPGGEENMIGAGQHFDGLEGVADIGLRDSGRLHHRAVASSRRQRSSAFEEANDVEAVKQAQCNNPEGNLSSPVREIQEMLKPGIVLDQKLAHPASEHVVSTDASRMHLRPVERPPSFAEVLKERFFGDALSIAYPTPFYGEKQDELQTRHSFGGLVIPVRASGADGYDLFPSFFDDLQTTVEILPRVVRPTERPPAKSQLKNILLDGKGPVRKRDRKDIFFIDSAGRQVQRRSQESVRDPFTSSSNPDVEFLPYRPRTYALSNICEEDSELSDDSEVRTPRPEQNHREDTFNEGEDSLLRNRPLSPKYDEGFQLFDNPNRQGVETPRRKGLDSAQRKSATLSSTKDNRNSTVYLSESMHRYQNLIVMSIEVIAECYSDKLPDPNQNQILAICALTQRDRKDMDQKETRCVTFAVNNSGFGKRLNRTILSCESEVNLLDALAAHILNEDPDVLVGFETQNSSVGFVLERSVAINHSFSQAASRWSKGTGFEGNLRPAPGSNSAAAAYYHRKGADIKITGRHVLSLWRIVRKEVKLPAYSREAVALELFRMTFPKHSVRDLESWLASAKDFDRAIRHLIRITSLNIAIVDKLNILSRTGELARVFGIDFMSVLTRGSQFRVESMLARVSQTRNFLLLAAPREEVFLQPAVEALPLVMEPQSAFYVDPVIVLDFQSLYPSVIIGHNLCYSTMLGNVNRISTWSENRRVGVLPKYTPPRLDHEDSIPHENIFVTSSGEMFVDSSIRRGILPQLLEEVLETRVMVKKALKGIVNDDSTAELLNARQFGLKMIANVTYGYTAASFSGRMPCAGLADAIVQCGRDSLEEIVRYVDEELREETGSTVVYGDTDSLFVQVPGATRDEAFDVGERIVKRASELFPDPITLKLEKVYQPCILQTKKRYVGYSYETREQAQPIFDAKGIETVRRDSCPLVQKALEKAIRILFETKNVSLVKKYVQRLCQKLHLDRIPFSDYIFRKEVRLGSYKEGHLPPAAIVATRAMEHDPRSVPRHGERVPFVVVYDRPGAPLKDCVASPEDYLDSARRGVARLNTTYYITKQILPTMNRVFSLIGVRVSAWYAEIPKPLFDPILPIADNDKKRARPNQSSLRMFYTTERCLVCHGKGAERQVCGDCLKDLSSVQASRFLLGMRARKQECNRKQLLNRCFECVDGRINGPGDVSCSNLTCPVYDDLSIATRKLGGLQQVLEDVITWKT